MENNATALAQPIDAEVRALIAALLEIEPHEIDADQDFFELGGDSVLVIKLVARIRRKLGVELTPGDVFDHPSVAALSTLLASRQSA
ncbi:acyl carrier protein [Paraburkholderia bannensis]|uniref:acyl carrier protein n=1 Tax=Paraburkholderia bannensis TaxID=765414 RepID=UPI002ABD5C86|nr:acyl carrier protein [Paraburkholderia bannensis]